MTIEWEKRKKNHLVFPEYHQHVWIHSPPPPTLVANGFTCTVVVFFSYSIRCDMAFKAPMQAFAFPLKGFRELLESTVVVSFYSIRIIIFYLWPIIWVLCLALLWIEIFSMAGHWTLCNTESMIELHEIFNIFSFKSIVGFVFCHKTLSQAQQQRSDCMRSSNCAVTISNLFTIRPHRSSSTSAQLWVSTIEFSIHCLFALGTFH